MTFLETIKCRKQSNKEVSKAAYKGGKLLRKIVKNAEVLDIKEGVYSALLKLYYDGATVKKYFNVDVSVQNDKVHFNGIAKNTMVTYYTFENRQLLKDCVIKGFGVITDCSGKRFELNDAEVQVAVAEDHILLVIGLIEV